MIAIQKTLVFCCGCWCVWMNVAVWGQVPVPAAKPRNPIALTGATLHTVAGEVIEAGTLLIDNGQIVALGTEVEIPDNAELRDVSGQHIYPGFIEPYSQLGLTEISSVSATIDHTETGDVNPNLQAQVAVNPDSDLLAVTRAGGVLLALTAPTGGLISGQSAVLQLEGWTYEDMTLRSQVALHINWPSASRGGRRRGPQPDAGGGGVDRVQVLKDWFADARRYGELLAQNSPPPVDLRLEGLQPVIRGEQPLMIRADQYSDIQAAVAFGVEQNVKVIILGGYDAPLCADLLRKHDVPVIVSAVYRNPLRRSEPDDHAYTLPARLEEAGIRFCISATDRSENWNTRNLPFHAGTAVGFGLSQASAIRAITLSAAEILGVSDRVGSLEPGKDGTFIIVSGNPLDTRSTITGAFIGGRPVNLHNRHQRLYEKYQQKYSQQREAAASDSDSNSDE